MKKTNSFWAGIVMICLSFSLSAQEVSISVDYPEQVKAGEIFELTVTINKGALSDYSRFSQDLPPGLTASNVHSPNADFSFDNQRIRVIWLKLPDESEIKIAYNVMVDERLTGSFMLGGVFAYVVDEERKFLNFDKSGEIKIIPSPTVDPQQMVDIKDFKAGAAGVVVAGVAEKEPFAMAIRQKPLLLSTGAYYVRLLLKNPVGSKYAKIEEHIPPGYIFESVDPHNGIESFSSSTVKFIWMKLPEEPEYEVTYRLVPKRDEPQSDMSIKGQLTYSVGNENKVVEVKEMDLDMTALSLADKRNLLLSGETPSGAVKDIPIAQKEPEQVKEIVPESKPAGASGQTIVNTRVLAVGSGSYYRVQLAAHQKPFDAPKFYKDLGVNQEVFVEQHNKLYKYTAGSFTTYNEANSYKEQVEKLRGVSGAFVVPYKDGSRIPLAAGR